MIKQERFVSLLTSSSLAILHSIKYVDIPEIFIGTEDTNSLYLTFSLSYKISMVELSNELKLKRLETVNYPHGSVGLDDMSSYAFESVKSEHLAHNPNTGMITLII